MIFMCVPVIFVLKLLLTTWNRSRTMPCRTESRNTWGALTTRGHQFYFSTIHILSFVCVSTPIFQEYDLEYRCGLPCFTFDNVIARSRTDEYVPVGLQLQIRKSCRNCSVAEGELALEEKEPAAVQTL